MRYPFVLNAAAKAELMQADALFMKRVRLNIIVSLLHVVQFIAMTKNMLHVFYL